MARATPIFVLLLAGCGDEAGPVEDRSRDRPLVAVVNEPLRSFVERIAGDQVQVWRPDLPVDVEDVRRLQDSDRVLLNGAGYSPWLQQVTLPPSRLVDTSASFADSYLTAAKLRTHRHGPEGEHTHGGAASHTWLDPLQAVAQARAALDALVELLPGREQDLRAAFDGLRRDLEVLDRDIEEVLAAHPDRRLVASHPVYQYLARRYGLKVESVHWEPDEEPDTEQWDHLDELLRTHPAQWMMWEGEPLPATAAGLEERGMRWFVFDPCEHGDYLTVMRRNVENLRRAYR